MFYAIFLVVNLKKFIPNQDFICPKIIKYVF